MLLISDSNILIDMIDGEVIDHMFTLPETFAVPDILFEEELREQHADLLHKGLQVLEMDGNTISRAFQLRQKYPTGPSQHDLNALALAISQNCPLLTGDRRLRQAAKAEQHTVKGTLWLMHRLFDEGELSKAAMREAYEKMEARGRRLPWEKVEQQLFQLAL